MSDFGGYELAIGSVTGLRAFNVDTFGRLTGIHHAQVWVPGENLAKCDRTRRTAECKSNHTHNTFSTSPWGGVGVPDLLPECREPHPCGGVAADCSCGFYAFYNGDNSYSGSRTITGVVSGYGRTEVGTKGFRCGKARIVALCLNESMSNPDPATKKSERRKKVDALVPWAWSLASAFNLIPGVLTLVNGGNLGVWLAQLLTGALFGVCAWSTCVTRRWEKRRLASDREFNATLAILSGHKQQPTTVWEKVRRNYPDVPVFDTQGEMLANFPLTRGQEPSPESDPQFWTRSAS